jgi:transformation/transcription domain-associated protein
VLHVLLILVSVSIITPFSVGDSELFVQLDLKTKHVVACELREMIDTVRDSESSRVFPPMIKNLLQTLSSGEPAFNKDSQDYQFRRVLLEIIHRIPHSDAVRNSGYPIFQGMIHLLRHDNEENGVTACKTIIDLIRSHRILKPEVVSELMGILGDLFRNMQGLVEETLSEDSAVVNPSVVLPSMRSFKVLAEMGLVIVTCLQQFRQVMAPVLPPTVPLCFEVLALESPMQKKARDDFEAMGGNWAGMAPSVKNVHAYTDFIAAQVKVCSLKC